MSEEIKPCPFCGGIPRPELQYEDEDLKTEFAIIACRNLGCHIKPRVGSTMSKGSAIESVIRRWNIRG
jgi:hypothetical protein